MRIMFLAMLKVLLRKHDPYYKSGNWTHTEVKQPNRLCLARFYLIIYSGSSYYD